MKRTAVVLAMLVAFVAGCPGAVEPQSARSIATNIREGIYFGDITYSRQYFLNGVLIESETFTEPYHEVVDENGLPLVQPGGDTPVAGLVLVSEVGAISSSWRIESVHASDNRLVIEFTGSAEFDGVPFGSIGSWTYEFFPPNRLDFVERSELISEALSDFGDVLSVSTTAVSTLTL